MILYHGTTESRAKKIIQDGVLSNNAERMYNDENPVKVTSSCGETLLSLATTPGFVYLTDFLFMAIYYGNKHSICNNENYFYVFKVDIDEKTLLPDMDEVNQAYAGGYIDEVGKYQTAKDTLERFHSVCYGTTIGEFKYCKLPTAYNWLDTNCDLIKEIVDAYVQGRSNNINQFFLNHIEQLKAELEKICNWQ